MIILCLKAHIYPIPHTLHQYKHTHSIYNTYTHCPGLLGFLEEPQARAEHSETPDIEELPISSNINKPRSYFIVYYNACTSRIILVTFYSTFCAVTHFHCVLLSICNLL